MTTPSAQDCETIIAMATSPALITSLVVCDLCCIAAIPLLIYWFARIWKMKLMHHNTRVLLCFHLACLLLHVIGRSVLHTTDLLIYITFRNGCEILHTRFQCFFLRLSYNIPMITSNCSAIFVSIERLIATFNIRNYEGGFRNVGYYLLLLQVLVSSCLLTAIYAPARIDHSPILYCQTTSTSNVMWTIYPFVFLLAMQILSFAIFEVAKRKNKGYSESSLITNTLTRRYQIEENLWTIGTLKVYVYTNAAFNATYLVALGAVIFKHDLFSKPIYYMLIEVTNALYLYALALPLVLWYNRKDVQNQIRYALDRNTGTNYNRVFEQLRSQWDSGDVIFKNKISTAKGTQSPGKKAFHFKT